VIDAPVVAPGPPRMSLRRSVAVARHPLVRLVARRLVGLVVVVFVVITATFGMVHLIPGDPLEAASGGTVLTPDIRARLEHQYGFDESLPRQYVRYLDHVVLHGDLGQSYTSDLHVSDLIRQRAGTSLELAGAALVLVLGVGIPLGMLAAVATREGRHKPLELGFTGLTSVVGAIPDYLAGTLLAFLFAVQFRLLPVAGSGSFKQLVLPALAVSLHSIANLSRIVRLETLNVLAQDYIRTARSERLPMRLIYARHALPNVLTAALTVGGLIFSGIVGGAVIVETVFARNGLGSALVTAVINKDYPVIQGLMIVLGATVVVVTAIVDILLGVVDPRSLAKEG
jgi:peptide/nickel transport system permease protein